MVVPHVEIHGLEILLLSFTGTTNWTRIATRYSRRPDHQIGVRERNLSRVGHAHQVLISGWAHLHISPQASRLVRLEAEAPGLDTVGFPNSVRCDLAGR